MPDLPIIAVAFDMDGLMFNTENVYFQVGCRLMERRGRVFTEELSAATMGRPPQKSFETMIEWHGLDVSWQTLHHESQETFFELLDATLAPMPGLMPLLEFLETRRIPKAICTGSTRRVLTEVLSRFDLEPRFDFTITADETTHGKPDPEIYASAAARFGVLPAKMLVLEDSELGCRSAAAAGTFPVAVPGNHSEHMDYSWAKMVLPRLDDPRVYELFG